jgi:hypothetical protein
MVTSRAQQLARPHHAPAQGTNKTRGDAKMPSYDAAESGVTPRTVPRTRRRAATSHRLPAHRSEIRVRRTVAAVTILIVVILIALGVHGCQVSQRNSALTDYEGNVATLIGQSDQTGSQLVSELSRGGGSVTAAKLHKQINQARVNASSVVRRARRIDVPGEVKEAQRYLMLALQMRRDAVANIAVEIPQALGTSASQDAIDSVAAEMARFNASDVLNQDYAAPIIAAAFRAAGIAGRDANGVRIASGQLLPNVEWLTPEYIALELGARWPSPSGKPAPGIHGHRMDSVSIGAATLHTRTPTTAPASPPPTFTCTFTNDGENIETNVVVKVSVSGTSDRGLAIVPETTPGQPATAQVTLNSSPPKGTYTLTATVEQVPGETALTHNTLSFPVTFQ